MVARVAVRLAPVSDFDVLVLGAGPGGYVAAIRASQLGLKVGVIEKKYWGGVCLNVGCIPSKALLRNAELAHILTHEKDKFGITGDASMDYKPTHARSREVSDSIVKGVHFLMKKNKIEEIDGWGTFVDAKTIEVEGRRRRVPQGDRRPHHHRHRRHHAPGAGHRALGERGHLRGADPQRPAPGLDRDRRLRRDRRGVRLRDGQLRRRRHHRGVPRPDGARPRTPRSPRSWPSTTRSSA